MAAHLGAWLGTRTRFAILERLRRAGLESVMGADRFVAGKVLTAALATLVITVAWSPAGVAPFFVLCAAGGIGFVLPDTWLSDRILQRQRSVLRELPFYLDVITLAVESGLNLASALSQAADKGPPGPLRAELERVLRDLRTGRLRAEALRAMAERLALPAVGSLVSALIVAEQQGSALAPILRAQAEQRRNERFQRAEKLAMEAPVKMLLPLLVFIFPCTFAVLLFPIVGRMLMEGWLK
jgi:tight adherence protein C